MTHQVLEAIYFSFVGEYEQESVTAFLFVLILTFIHSRIIYLIFKNRATFCAFWVLASLSMTNFFLKKKVLTKERLITKL